MSPLEVSAPPDRRRSSRRALAFDHLDDGVIVVTLDGVVRDWNTGAERMFGWRREEMLGKSPDLLQRAQEEPRTAEIAAAVRKDGRWSGQMIFVRKDGTVGVCETVATLLKDERGQTIAMIGVSRDVTARQHLEWELGEERLLLRALMDAVPDPIFCKDREGRYILHNAANQRMFATESKE